MQQLIWFSSIATTVDARLPTSRTMVFFDTEVDGVVVIEPAVHRDRRGYFLETFHAEKYVGAGIPTAFAQDNQSFSTKHTLRGLHLQVRKPQGKLVRVVQGQIWDVAVDVRPGSPTFNRWTAALLSANNFRQLYIPPGCAHGFCVLSATATVEYKCTELYDPADETGIFWADPAIGITWPITTPVLSDRDRQLGSVAEYVDRLAGVTRQIPADVRMLVAR